MGGGTEERGITSDQIIQIKGTKADCIPIELRRVRFVNPEDLPALFVDSGNLSGRQVHVRYRVKKRLPVDRASGPGASRSRNSFF